MSGSFDNFIDLDRTFRDLTISNEGGDEAKLVQLFAREASTLLNSARNCPSFPSRRDPLVSVFPQLFMRLTISGGSAPNRKLGQSKTKINSLKIERSDLADTVHLLRPVFGLEELPVDQRRQLYQLVVRVDDINQAWRRRSS
jgi:hypothetical protein